MIKPSTIYVSLAFLLLSFNSQAQSNNEPTRNITRQLQDRITVYVFLHESCVISQYYTLPLRELHEEYANENVQFKGLFPNFSSKPNQIETFKEKYQIPFELKTDYYHKKKEQFNMKKIIPFLLFGIVGIFYADAQVNFSEHIAPIIYNNCTSCHRSGEVGPMHFTNYQEVVDWAGMIQYVTEIR